jgi:hypothetical protein
LNGSTLAQIEVLELENLHAATQSLNLPAAKRILSKSCMIGGKNKGDQFSTKSRELEDSTQKASEMGY